MAYVFLTDLDQALQAGGVPYTEVPFSYSDPTGAPSWRERGRPASTGGFDPEGVLCHHTASPIGTTAETDLRVILSGNGDAPGPISQLYVARDGAVYLVAAGRANHGGKGVRPGVDGGCADMNYALVGIEAGNNGVGEPWGDAMCASYARLVAALAEWYGYATDAVYLHATTGPPYGGCNSKIDPAGPWLREPHLVGSTTWDLGLWRNYVDEHRGAQPPQPPPMSTAYEEESQMASTYQVSYGAEVGLPDGSVWELVHGTRRNVTADEWYQVLKGAMADRAGVVPPHEPYQPVAYLANGWYLAALPEYDGGAH